MQCPSCGKEVPFKSLNCPACGYPIDDPRLEPVYTNGPQTVLSQKSNPDAYKHNAKRGVSVFIIIAVIVLGFCGIYFGVMHQNLKDFKRLFIVKVTLPASYSDVTGIDDSLDKEIYKYEDIVKSVHVLKKIENPDGTTTLVMSRIQHNKLMIAINYEVQDYLEELEKAFTNITIQKDDHCKEITVYTEEDKLYIYDDLNIVCLYFIGYYYQVFDGADDVDAIDVRVKYINKESKKVLADVSSKDIVDYYSN